MKVKFRCLYDLLYRCCNASTPRYLIKWSYDGLKSMTAKIIIKKKRLSENMIAEIFKKI